MDPSHYMSTNPFYVAEGIVKNKGYVALYNGLDAALVRQMFYATSRLGIYRSIFNYIKNK